MTSKKDIPLLGDYMTDKWLIIRQLWEANSSEEYASEFSERFGALYEKYLNGDLTDEKILIRMDLNMMMKFFSEKAGGRLKK